MKAFAVIGANYGDEGKGLMTDFLTREHGAEIVVRFNGGAQAGHTVTYGDKRRVFSHFSSGTFAHAATYLSEDFICNPILFVKELKALNELGYFPRVFVHPDAIVTTPHDMLLNQCVERMRTQRHGSCGVGINETVERSLMSKYRLTVRDLLSMDWIEPLAKIAEEYAIYRAVSLGLDSKDIRECSGSQHDEEFVKCMTIFRDYIEVENDTILKNKTVVFEGAQGLALDQNNMNDFPHLTRSNTGSRNIVRICNAIEATDVELVYATRSYLTRHGAGPLKDECTREEISDKIVDETNLPHPFQGTLRFAPLDKVALNHRIWDDLSNWADVRPNKFQFNVAVTCQDQFLNPMDDFRIYGDGPSRSVKYNSFGPSHIDVRVQDYP